MKIILISFFILFSFSSTAQRSKKNRTFENYFGLTYKPLIPFGLVGDKPLDIVVENFTTNVKPTFGYSFGGNVRTNFTKLIAIETGIIYTRRNYITNFEIPDSSLTGSNDFGYINFDIPINTVVYIRLGEKFYANTTLGISINFNASDIRTQINPIDDNLFIVNGRRPSFFSFDINANVGFEYRTEEKGFFYLGVAGKIPLNPIMTLFSTYRKDTYILTSTGQDIAGATFALDLRYFFHNIKNKGKQFKAGPIEQ